MSIKVATAFLDRLQRSGLVATDEMLALRHELEARGIDLENANAIADTLIDMQVLTRWQADKVLEGKHKGFFLGSYRLLRPLGRGGMGAVFLAQHEMMRRQCALKVLPHSQIKEGSSVLKRFYVEAQAVAALDHQNIVRAYDVAMESKDGKDIHYLVMEYVEGQDLQTMVQEQGVLDFVKAAEYLRQTAHGLAHAHEAGLVHRDIKPANLLVDKKGVVKVLDLGLARFFDDSGQASLTTAFNETVLGTADYLSPEQALNSHTVDHRTDIYSLGCTAYFLLVGNPPFPDGTVAQRLVAHQVKMPAPIKDKRSDAPQSLVAIIDKMMAKKPEERFQTATDVANILARWLIEYGGDDWKRQHTEITANKALMSLLSAREPTRTIRSSMSETELELELAPLDDDDEDAGMISASSASGSNLNLAGSGIRKSGESSTSRRRTAATPKRDEDLASLHDDLLESPAAKSRPADSAVPASAAEGPGAQSPLPSLEDGTGGEGQPLADFEVADLGPAGAGDLLADLDQHDLMGTGLGDDPLGAMDSDLRKVTLSDGGASSSKSHRRKVPAAEKPESASIIGWPIVIGGGCGLLLVLIILAVIKVMSEPKVAELPSRPQVAMVPELEVTESEPEKAEPTAPPDRDERAREKPTPVPKPEQQPVVEPEQPVVEPELAFAEPEEPVESEDQLPEATEVPDAETEVLPPKKPIRDIMEPVEQASAESAEPEEPEVETLPPEVYLAAIEGFRIDWKEWSMVGQSPGKIPPQMKPLMPLLSNVIGATAREIEDTLVKRCRLTMDANQEPVLTVEPVFMIQAPNIHLGMKAVMTVEDSSGEPLVLWENQRELMTFMPSANPSIVLKNIRPELSRLFNDFRLKYDAAVAAQQAP
jgi:serine/threonine protein kinase